ncbi:MAG: MaoC family dehydratase [Candidatus Dormibacteraceae bacterium]
MSGRWFEELSVGLTVEHAVRRTISEADSVFFSSLTMNPTRLHLDAVAAAESEFGRRTVDNLYVLSLLVGLSSYELTLGTMIANLGYDSIEFPGTVFPGDTIHAVSQIIESRPSRSRPETGIVAFEHRAFNHQGELVASCVRRAMMERRPA